MSAGDAELLLLDAAGFGELRDRVAGLAGPPSGSELSEPGQDLEAELTGGAQATGSLAALAAELAGSRGGGPVRAAVVATDAVGARRTFRVLVELLDAGVTKAFLPDDGVFLGRATTPPRIAYLFPAQGGKVVGGAVWRRYPEAAEVLRAARLADGADAEQPRVVAGSLAAARLLGMAGVDAHVAVGHSLGEFTALSWAGCLDPRALLDLVGERARVMASASAGGGAMAVLGTGADTAAALAVAEDVGVAGDHAPDETVVAGPADAVDRVCEAARGRGFRVHRLRVPHAFHTAHVSGAAEAMGEALGRVRITAPEREVVSTVTGRPVGADDDPEALLREQVRRPVLFRQAVARALRDVDLAVEVGPGRVLAGLAARVVPDVPVLATDTTSPDGAPLLAVLGAAHALGAEVDLKPLLPREEVPHCCAGHAGAGE
ncbi:acyltransferase domain-containing protein [Actinosynnema pretiosum subsp. pretiosum]|uniref:[acyl-carrier-protein] S-malonyltransferase n=1 Tax=Actinosynnema pretiosum subsp. pretiosum TaxID=103721 RepID=A0AA45R4C8_9PSEU|nr:acyltransferase domain-containing protein [Actinosynnema pretiosum subsp. pretiosum]